MNTAYYNKITRSTAHRAIRDTLSFEVLQDKTLLNTLLGTALNTQDKNHHKACWILELVIEEKPEWLKEYLDIFCATLASLSNHSAMRPLSKICVFALEYDVRHQGFLTTLNKQRITEACFDWLIEPATKVATKAYAMRSLFFLGKNEAWIHPELSRILSEDTAMHSAAYKAAAKDVLIKIKKCKNSNTD